jgi:hypothetical protein
MTYRASGRETGSENLALGSETLTLSGNTIVARRDDDGNTLETELHDLVTLPSLVVDVEVLTSAVGDGDDIRGLVNSALQLALVTSSLGVWVWRIDWGVSSDWRDRLERFRITGVVVTYCCKQSMCSLRCHQYICQQTSTSNLQEPSMASKKLFKKPSYS